MNRIAGTLTRRLTLLTACAALAAAPVLAQQDTPPPPPPAAQTPAPPPGGGRGGMNPERRLQMMKDQLGLTEDQTKQVKAIMDESRGRMEGVRAETGLSREDMRSKNMVIMRDENKHLRAVLTADQLPKYDAMLERMRANRQGGPGGPGGPPSPQPPPPPQQ